MRPILRVLGRIGIVVFACAFLTVVGLQYARVLHKDIALAHELDAVHNDVLALQAKRIEQQREIRRLSDPHGAIPEIHDKLHMVTGREAIIYLKKHRGE